MVTPRFYPSIGGVETHVAQVARRLVQAGVDLTVLTTDTTGMLPAYEQVEGAKIHRVRAWPRHKDWYFAPQIFNIICNGDWDLVHCQSYHTFVAPLAMLAARRAKIPYVVTFHGGGSSSHLRNTFRRGQWLMLRPLLARAAKLIAIAQFEIELYGQFLRLPELQFTLIPNGCDLTSVPPMSRTPIRGSRIVSVGRLERYKGHHRLIAALPTVLEHCPDAYLQIIGTGPYESELRNLSRRLNVEDRVEIGGIAPTDREGMAQALGRAALVALLSDYETHPIAALEAASLGRPLLVADTSGLRELAVRGLARSIGLQSSLEQIGAALLDQLRHPLIPHDVVLPSWEECATDLLALYRSIVTEPICES